MKERQHNIQKKQLGNQAQPQHNPQSLCKAYVGTANICIYILLKVEKTIFIIVYKFLCEINTYIKKYLYLRT
jgi:hypothetical protein